MIKTKVTKWAYLGMAAIIGAVLIMLNVQYSNGLVMIVLALMYGGLIGVVFGIKANMNIENPNTLPDFKHTPPPPPIKNDGYYRHKRTPEEEKEFNELYPQVAQDISEIWMAKILDEHKELTASIKEQIQWDLEQFGIAFVEIIDGKATMLDPLSVDLRTIFNNGSIKGRKIIEIRK